MCEDLCLTWRRSRENAASVLFSVQTTPDCNSFPASLQTKEYLWSVLYPLSPFILIFLHDFTFVKLFCFQHYLNKLQKKLDTTPSTESIHLRPPALVLVKYTWVRARVRLFVWARGAAWAFILMNGQCCTQSGFDLVKSLFGGCRCWLRVQEKGCKCSMRWGGNGVGDEWWCRGGEGWRWEKPWREERRDRRVMNYVRLLQTWMLRILMFCPLRDFVRVFIALAAEPSGRGHVIVKTVTSCIGHCPLWKPAAHSFFTSFHWSDIPQGASTNTRLPHAFGDRGHTQPGDTQTQHRRRAQTRQRAQRWRMADLVAGQGCIHSPLFLCFVSQHCLHGCIHLRLCVVEALTGPHTTGHW